MRFVLVWAGLVAGNFSAQLLSSGDWTTALERSWFQALALVAFGLSYWIVPPAASSATKQVSKD